MSTEDLARGLAEQDKARGRQSVFMQRPPWHGTFEVVGALEARGLVDVDPGVAEFHAPGTPAPTAQEFYLDLTEAGRQVLADNADR